MLKFYQFLAAYLVLISIRFIRTEITGPKHGKVVVCYIGTWAVYRPGRGSFAIENIDPNLCTHLIYSFAGLNVTDDSIRSLDPWQDLTDNYGKGGYERLVKLKNKYPHLKVTLAIGGWNEGSANYSQMAGDAARRGNFVRNALEFIRKYNFDGLDLDWEFPGKRGGSPNDKNNFLLLVKELRAAFNKNNLLLTAALGAGKDTIDIAYDVAGLSVYLDFIHMMCYDYHGAWDSKTGANAPLKSTGDDFLNVEYTIEYMLKLGAKPEKLVMGVPLYGRTFYLVQPQLAEPKQRKLGDAAKNAGFKGPFTREDGFMGYNEICLELKNSSLEYTIHWDKQTQTPFATEGDKVIAYDDEESIKAKVKYAMSKKIGGVMVWSLDTDDFQGDCHEANSKTAINFPLMHSINDAIVEAKEDMDRNRDNEIPDDSKEKENSAKIITSFKLYTMLVLIFVCKMV